MQYHLQSLHMQTMQPVLLLQAGARVAPAVQQNQSNMHAPAAGSTGVSAVAAGSSQQQQHPPPAGPSGTFLPQDLWRPRRHAVVTAEPTQLDRLFSQVYGNPEV